jgi:hypothetical protein
VVSLNQAQKIAADKTKTPPYSEYSLTPTTKLPLRLPFGYRFPYDSYVRDRRLRESMVILFVNDEGGVEVEWDDFEQGGDRDRAKRFRKTLEETQPDLPSLPDVIDKVQSIHKNAQVEMVEPVLAELGDRDALLHWKVGIVDGIERSTILISGTPDVLDVSEVNQRAKYFASIQWQLGRARYKARMLTVNLRGLLEEQEHLRCYWTVWSCISRIIAFVEKLGYSKVGLQNVYVDRVVADPKAGMGAIFEGKAIKGMETVVLVGGGGWDTDVSIILHELGHALWWFLYTRPPRQTMSEVHKTARNAIKEAFSDYLAATILAGRRRRIEIGAGLDPQVAALNKLPRLVDGKPFILSAFESDPHEIGRKWANLLWDFRGRVGQDDADSVIVAAHIKPRVEPDGPDEPMAAYFHSLKNTAAFLGVDFDDWDALAQKHHLVL